MTEEEYFSEHGPALGFASPLSAGLKPYEFNLNFAQSKLQSGEFMADLVTFLKELGVSYAGGRPHLLFYPMKPSDITVVVKPYESVLNKIFRINFIDNPQFPEDPSQWPFVSADNLYDHIKINDLLRCQLVCKYMDGPKFVAEGLKKFCKQKNLEFKYFPKSSDRGYYAWHCYIQIPVELMFGGTVSDKRIWFEIQLSTQLADVISQLTHGLYEGIRINPTDSDEDEWRWRPRSQRFRSAYLGHTLHLLEGVIQTFRDEVLELEGDPAASDTIDNANTSLPGDAPNSGEVESAAGGTE